MDLGLSEDDREEQRTSPRYVDLRKNAEYLKYKDHSLIQRGGGRGYLPSLVELGKYQLWTAFLTREEAAGENDKQA